MQLFQCASDALGDLVLKAHPRIQTETIEVVMQTMRDLAVIPVAIGVRRAELMDLSQGPDEPFRTFAARAKGKAETCAFSMSVRCTCNRTVEVDYTTETVRDVLLAGISDLDIRREALSMQDIQKKSINEVISFVESREMARNATPSSSMAAVSSFRRKHTESANKKTSQRILEPLKPLENADGNKSTPCPDCGKMFNAFKQRANGSWNTKPHRKCVDCWRLERRKPQGVSANAIEAVVTQVGAIDCAPTPTGQIMPKRNLKRHRGPDHPRVELNICQKNKDQPVTTIRAVADSGAMSNLWGLQQYLQSGYKKSDLKVVNMNIRAANKNRINIVGAFEAMLEGRTPSGETISCLSLVYVSDSVNEFFLSFDSMLDLGIINQAFPSVGAYLDNAQQESAESGYTQETLYVRALNSGCTDPADGEVSCKWSGVSSSQT